MVSSTDTMYLGRTITAPVEQLDFFATPIGVTHVRAVCSEISALCPITSQPDLYTVTIDYAPGSVIVESKALKLWLWRYRNRGISAEQLAAEIARELFEQLVEGATRELGAAGVDVDDSKRYVPSRVDVTAEQRSRGGIALTASASWPM